MMVGHLNLAHSAWRQQVRLVGIKQTAHSASLRVPSPS